MSACCRVERLGPSHVRTLVRRDEVPPEDLEARFEWLAAVREWLLAAVGGCPNTRDLLLDLISGRVQLTEVAKKAGWSLSKASRVLQAALERIRWAAQLATVADSLLAARNAFTLDPETASPVGPVPMWAVSLAKFGACLPHRPSRDDLMRFLAARAMPLRLRRGRRRYFGVWSEHPGVFWLDVTVLIPHREAAVAFARRNRQRAITHLATGEEIRLPVTERRRSS